MNDSKHRKGSSNSRAKFDSLPAEARMVTDCSFPFTCLHTVLISHVAAAFAVLVPHLRATQSHRGLASLTAARRCTTLLRGRHACRQEQNGTESPKVFVHRLISVHLSRKECARHRTSRVGRRQGRTELPRCRHWLGHDYRRDDRREQASGR
jgi:hypothetical protein